MADMENRRPDSAEAYEGRAVRRKRRQAMDVNVSVTGIPVEGDASVGSYRSGQAMQMKAQGAGRTADAEYGHAHSGGMSESINRRRDAGSKDAGSKDVAYRASSKPSSAKAKAVKKKASGRKRKSFTQLLKESWFYRIYFLLLLLCAVALALGLRQLWVIAAEYEETRPIHSAEPYLELFEQRDWNALQAIDVSADALKYDAEGQYVQQMDALLREGEFSLKSIVTIDEREQQYNLLLDGRKIGELTLEQSDEMTKHGMARWQLKQLETQVLTLHEYSVTVPADSVVTVNGMALGESDILERDIPVVDSNNLPDGVTAPTLVRYGVHMNSLQPENIVVTDRHGATQVPEQDGEYSFSWGLAWDDAQIKAQVEENVVTWGRRIAAFTSNDYDKGYLYTACINPSPARTYIRNMENQWAPGHNGYDFENIETGEYYIYADSCFSCRISFDYILHYPSGDRKYPTRYTLYFAKDGSRFKLYSFTMDASQDNLSQDEVTQQ